MYNYYFDLQFGITIDETITKEDVEDILWIFGSSTTLEDVS